MKVLATAAAALFLLVNALVLAPVAPLAAAQQPLTTPKPMLRVDVTSLSPRVVDQTADTLTVTARVTNIANVAVYDLRARVEVGAAQTTVVELEQALRGGAPTDTQATPFRPLSPVLEPGQSAELRVVADLQGSPDGLLFTEPGVYPLLINVNGTPQDSGEARLAAANLLLPVRAAPGGEPAQRPASPLPLSTLWPIASEPRVVADPVRGSIVLSDDELADEMRPGGRLHALVEAAADARNDDPELSGGLCFGVDPELLSTAQAMTHGYRVRDGLSIVTGSGADDARAWLASLRELVDGQCVLPTSYAGADLPALAARTPKLAVAAADRDGGLSELLDVQPEPGAIWSTGALTDRAVQALRKAGKELVVGSAGDLDAEGLTARPTALAVGDGDGGDSSGELRVLPYDDLVTDALTPGSASRELPYHATVAADDSTIAGQNAVATVLFRAAAAQRGESGPLLLAPPQVWHASADELRWVLSTLGQLHAGGVVEATGLSALRAGEDTESPVRPAVSKAAAGRLPSGVAAAVARVERTVDDFAKAVDVDPGEGVSVDVITTPLHNALLRAASVEFSDDPSARARAVDDAQSQLDGVLESVSVTDPKRTISLASGSSPIPVSIANRLPVEVTVQVALSNTAGLRPSEVDVVDVPAGRSRNVKIPAEALRAGRFTVDVQLSTPGGTRLGEPTRFELASTEYGLITVIVTATAAGALLLLAGRRIYRRLTANGSARG